MEVTFNLTKDDLRRVWLWARRPLWLTCLGLCLTFIVQLTLVGIVSHDYALGAALSFITLPFYFAAALLRSRRLGMEAANKALARDPRLVGPRTVRLERDGLFLCLPSEQRHYPWEAVQGCDLHSRYLLILVRAVGIIAIPFAAFGGRPDAKVFETALMAYKLASMEGPPPVATPAEDDATVWPPPPRKDFGNG